ncbi:GntR family transcriptional regulator [Streptomyces sp. B146]|uniref:HTH domain-containing protein n=1 Tax=Streptomyces olivaceus TaxID=47716 RepID=UPI00240D60D4|nr:MULTISPECIES: HTH domain-containing protein [Streptomyces]WFB88864.1 GntR family transcriptional regulator [Streptomyces olivaceus]WGK51268.1 GntR family transcriptional regulator [Streptomyces sp. B146]
MDGAFPASQPLTSEGALAKQFGVTRPKVRQDLSEVRASGPVEAIKGRGTFAHSPHRVAPAPRARRVRRPSDGSRIKADGVRWTDAEPTVATRSRRSTGPSGSTSHPVGRADAHIQRLADRRPRPSSSTPPDIRPVLGAHRHQVRGGGHAAGALHGARRPGPRAPLHGVHPHPHAFTRPGSGATTRRRGPEARAGWLRLSLRHQGGSFRSPRAARPPAGPALLPSSRSSPAGARAARTEISYLRPEKGYVVAGAVGSTALATSPVRVPRRARPGGHSCTLRAGPKPAQVASQRTAP